MKKALILLFLLAAATVAVADGLKLKSGRYPGRVLVFMLTEDQKQLVERYRNCHLKNFKVMNRYTPYAFELTESQSKAIHKRKGFSPKRFVVYETYRGFNDAGPHWNLVLRHSPDQFEIPLDLVVSDSEATKEHEMQGWEPTNPCFPVK